MVEIKQSKRPGAVRRKGSCSPLELLAKQKLVDGSPFLPVEAVSAGERLFADFMRGQMQPRVTASLTPRLETRVKGHQADSASDCALDARQRVRQALRAVGPELADVALDFCCFMKGLELIERERQWPVRSAKLMVRTALLALARHYAPSVPQKAQLRQWGDQDFRPLARAFGIPSDGQS
ncbi:hypothetical protein FJU08_14105 [Martelella alba]|uniref:DUF6456 domain-containing protein n=1 Tax=Martelella alba TaxID=2590451 RepID=A0A506U510_9HYPH|nr:DUF6456 domain-containing protein [Martelella alba]TPW29463.1 hypothetical protein FJU08_14105 [Martelella alba]